MSLDYLNDVLTWLTSWIGVKDINIHLLLSLTFVTFNVSHKIWDHLEISTIRAIEVKNLNSYELWHFNITSSFVTHIMSDKSRWVPYKYQVVWVNGEFWSQFQDFNPTKMAIVDNPLFQSISIRFSKFFFSLKAVERANYWGGASCPPVSPVPPAL